MPFSLYPPGTRKGNKFYVAVGRIKGRQYEINTRQTNARSARKSADDFEIEVRKQLEREQREAVAAAETALQTPTFEAVAVDYIMAKNIQGGNNERFVGNLVSIIGHKLITDVTGADLIRAANELYPGRTAATKNRNCITPGAAILHWAAESELCPYRRIRKLQEIKPKRRRPAVGTMETLIDACEGYQRLLLVILYCQGWRISETLSLTWEDHTRLDDREFDLYVKKAKSWKTVQMHPDVFAELNSVPKDRRMGSIFPWRTRFGVYRWLRPLCQRLGVQFTPHQARHAFASDLNASGATDETIAAVGSWTSTKSVTRYTDVSKDEARGVLLQRGRIKTTRNAG